MSEYSPGQNRPSAEDVIGSIGRRAIRMDQLIVPGSEPLLDVFVDKDGAGFTVFGSSHHGHKSPPKETLFGEPLRPNLN